MGDEQEQQYREAFKIFDKDGDGNITKAELAKVIKNLGHTASDQEIEDMINGVDQDGNGEIGFDEFVLLMKQAEQKDLDDVKEKQMRETFNKFDVDGSGTITRSELKEAMRELGNEATDAEIDDMMAAADENNDGVVDFEEFKKMMG